MSPSTRRTSPEPFGVVTVSVPERRSVERTTSRSASGAFSSACAEGARLARLAGAPAAGSRELLDAQDDAIDVVATHAAVVRDAPLAVASVVEDEQRRDLRELDAQRVDHAHRAVVGLGDGARGEDDVVAAGARALACHLRAVGERDTDAALAELRGELGERVDVVVDEKDATTRHWGSRPRRGGA